MARRTIDTAARRDNLLIELGVEELPPTTLHAIAQAFADQIVHGLAAAGLVETAPGDAPSNASKVIPSPYQYFATPRRLAVLVANVAAQQPSRVLQRRGPALQSAVDQDGKPSRAAEGFAKSCGVLVSELATMENDKGAWLVHSQKVSGEKLSIIVNQCFEKILRHLPIPKRMRWGEREVEFVRPAHWLVVLHGTKVLKTTMLGLQAGRMTRGHRFHANIQLPIPNAADYAEILYSQGKVIADFTKRRTAIESQIKRLANNHKLWQNTLADTPQNDTRTTPSLPIVKADEPLLDFITGLVEWPQVVVGKFERRFLQLPSEVLASAMRNHQKYFCLVDANGNLLPAFITVSNTACKTNSTAYQHIQQGNERVLRARLTDAEFFWNNDLKTRFTERIAQLKNILFHNKLGSLHEKIKRLVPLAEYITAQLDATADDIQSTARAAWLCKADLATDMVGEFPELQGLIGCHYALADKEKSAVAHAIEQHYWPRQAGDPLPNGIVAQSVAIADRIDTLVGMFASGEIPSGDKDPFALRRAALSVLRIIIEQKLDLDIVQLLQKSQQIYTQSAATDLTFDPAIIAQVFAFMLERLKSYYQAIGYQPAEITAVLVCKPAKPLDFDLRLRALRQFFNAQPAAAADLVIANKRIANILKKADYHQNQAYESVECIGAETDIAKQLADLGQEAKQHFHAHNYPQGLQVLAKLRQPIADFFENTMVMHEDMEIRNRRLGLLYGFRQLFLEVADISCLSVDE